MTDPESELADLKAALRHVVRERVVALTAERRRQAAHGLAGRLADLAPVRDAGAVMAFLSLPTEIDTWPLIRWAWREGKRVAVPRVEGKGGPADRAVVPVWLEAADVEAPAAHPALAPGPYGILEPAGATEAAVAALDVLVAPCEAVDRAGRRLGKGGGFFDRFLALPDFRAAVVGVGFAEQVADEVPVGPHDRRVDWVVTDREVIDARPGAAGAGADVN